MREENLKQKIREGRPFLCILVLVAVWHIMMNPGTGDDEYYSNALHTMALFDLLKTRYMTWSSRVIIELVLFGIINHVIVWKILDTLIFTSISYMMSRILDCDEKGKWFCCFLLIMYPFNDMESAGWITTTVNYMWPLWCTFFLGILLKKVVKGENIRWYETVLACAAIIFASNQEQCAAMILTLFVIIIAYKLRKGEWKQPFLYLGLILNLLSFAFIIMCPGNAERSFQEASNRMPEFFEFSAVDKIYLGLLNTERVFIAIPNRLMIVVAVVFVFLIVKKTGKFFDIMVAMIPNGIILGYSVLSDTYYYYRKIFFVPEQVTRYDAKSLVTYVPIMFLGFMIAGILYTLYRLLGEKMEQYLFIVVILTAGFATAVVMGFSPTIYASAGRVFIYLYFAFIFACAYCYKKASYTKQETTAEHKVWMIAAVAWAMANFGYVGYCCLTSNLLR